MTKKDDPKNYVYRHHFMRQHEIYCQCGKEIEVNTYYYSYSEYYYHAECFVDAMYNKDRIAWKH